MSSTGAITSNHIIRSDAGHNTARVEAVYDDQNSTYPQYNGSILMWASEPGITYDSGGIGVNVNTSGQYYGRKYNYGYATYMRFEKSNGNIAFYQNQGTAGTAGAGQVETFRVDETGKVKLATTGGIGFGGSTAAANLLDDYEEGTFNTTFTPTTSGSITLHTSYRTLHFIKIGRLVTVTGYIVVSSVSSPVGVVSIGMPFTHENVYNNQTSVQMSWNGISSGSISDAWGIMSPNTNYINVYTGSGSSVGTDWAQKVAANTDLRICVTFLTT